MRGVRVLGRTVPDWTYVLGAVVVIAALPLVLGIESWNLACATAKHVVADPNNPANTLTMSKGSVIRVTVPLTGIQTLFQPDVSSSDSNVLSTTMAPCPGPAPSGQAPTFYFKALGEGSARLQTAGSPNIQLGMYDFGWPPVTWDVTVGPDYSPLWTFGIDAGLAAIAAAVFVYRRRSSGALV